MTDGDLELAGQAAIVTGAARGLGRCHAELLAERGASVVIADVAGVDEAVEAIVSAGGRAVGCTGSVTERTAAEAMVAAAVEAFGGIHIVVNNAGILRSADLGELTDELWDSVVEVSLRGTMNVTRAAWPLMAEQGYGRVVSTTSNSGLLGIAGSTAYAAAKAGIYGMTRALAIEGEPLGIGVNAVAPMAYTDMSATSRIAPRRWRSGEGDSWSNQLEPRRVSPAVAWLCHRDCALTGEVLSSAGGRVARFFMALTEGFADDELTPELVRDHLDEVLDTEGHAVLPRASDEGLALHRRLLG